MYLYAGLDSGFSTPIRGSSPESEDVVGMIGGGWATTGTRYA